MTAPERGILVAGAADGAVRSHEVLDARSAWTVRRVADREGALDALDEEWTAVVVGRRVDGMTGLEFAAVVHERAPDVPVVVATAGDGVPESAAAAVGVAGVLTGVDDLDGAELAARLDGAVNGAPTRGPPSDRSVAEVLDARNRQLEAAVEHTPVVLFAIDDDGRFVLSQGGGLAALGLDPGEVVGESVYDMYDDHPEVVDCVERALAGEEVTARITTGGVTFETTYQPVSDDEGGVECVVGIARDVTELEERERELTQLNRAVAAAPIGITVSDATAEDNPLVYANEEFERLTGYSREEILGRNCRFLQGPGTDREQVARLREAIDAREPVSVELRNYRKDGTEFWNRVTVAPVENEDGEVTNFVGFQEDVTERKRYEAVLTSLHHTTRELIRSEDREEIARRVADAGNAILDTAGATVFLFDSDRSALVPTATAGLTAADPTLSPIHPDPDDPAWQTFVDGDTAVYHDEGTDALEGRPLRSVAYVPLGDHGLFAVAVDESGSIDDRAVDLAELLGANAEVALDRLERERTIRARDAELRRRADRLAQLDEVNERVRTIIHDLVGATTRDGIEEVVCEGLADADRFELVCLLATDRLGDGVAVASWDGAENGYLDAVGLGSHEGDGVSREPSLRAANSHEPVVVEDVAGDPRSGEWRGEALSRGYRSVLSVPLVSGGVRYGVLSVYATEPQTFDGETREVLADLGTTVAHAIRATDQRRALLSDRQVELEFAVTGGSTPLFAFSDRFECELVVDRVLPRSEETHIAYAIVSGLDADGFRAAVADAVAIERGRVISETPDGIQVELLVSGASMAGSIADHGGAFQKLTARDGDGTVSMVFPSSGEISAFIEMFARGSEGVELLARREHGDTDEEAPDGTLTPRQREVLEAAFASGFFDWPRGSTGEQIADTLDISAPTFQEHLRRAQRKVVADFLARDREPRPVPNGD